MEISMKKLSVVTALLLTLTPVLAFATPRTSGAHMRPQLFHDRTPKVHIHQIKPHHTA